MVRAIPAEEPMQTAEAPSSNKYSEVIFEKGVVTDVNRATFTVTVESVHSGKTFPDIQPLSPYHHFDNGEGIHHLPEVGAECYVMSPSDNTPALIVGYTAPPRVLTSTDETPQRSTTRPEGSSTDVSYKSKRPDMNPGDIGITGRDENFLMLHRGGVLSLGATGISQRIYIPVGNYIKDFCENYGMHHFGGDLEWTVERPEKDPKGKAPCTYVFQLHEFASDAKASVRIRHMPLTSGKDKKSAWDIQVAPQGIDKEKGSVSGATYTMMVLMDGTKTEFVGANRTLEIKGDDTVKITGKRTTTVGKDDSLEVTGALKMKAKGEASLEGAKVSLGGAGAAEMFISGTKLLQIWPSLVFDVKGVVATPNPSTIALLKQCMSKKVFGKL
jgi:hypothetical protein